MNNSKMPYKCGQNVRLNEQTYLFLGYTDIDCKRGWIADKHGNGLEVQISNLSNLSRQ
jgi:hypothetical protein